MLVKNAMGYTPERPCAAVNCAVSATLLRTRESSPVKFAWRAEAMGHKHGLKAGRGTLVFVFKQQPCHCLISITAIGL